MVVEDYTLTVKHVKLHVDMAKSLTERAYARSCAQTLRGSFFQYSGVAGDEQMDTGSRGGRPPLQSWMKDKHRSRRMLQRSRRTFPDGYGLHPPGQLVGGPLMEHMVENL